MNQESIPTAPVPSETISVNQIPPSPKPKLPLVFMGIILLILFSFGGILLVKYLYIPKNVAPIPAIAPKTTVIPTSISDVTADWKTYSDTSLGYSLKYPNNLKITIPKLEANIPVKYAVFTDMNVLFNGSPDDASVLYKKIGGIGGSGGVIIYKGFWLRIETTGLDSSDDVINNIRQANKNTEQIIINGITGYKRSAIDEGGGYKNTTFWVDIINGKKVYSIKTQFLSSNKDYQILFDQILSTFKFTDQITTTDPTVDWKLYSPPDNAYLFKYPNDENWKLTETKGSYFVSFDVQCFHLDCPYNIYDFGGGISNVKSINEYIQAFNTTNPAGSSKATPYIQDYQKIKINGLDAVKTLVQTGEMAGSGPIVTVFVVNKGQGYSFGYTYKDKNLNTATNFSQLPAPNPDFISTLKFTN